MSGTADSINRRFPTLLLGFVAAIVVWCLDLLGFCYPIDQRFMDGLIWRDAAYPLPFKITIVVNPLARLAILLVCTPFGALLYQWLDSRRAFWALFLVLSVGGAMILVLFSISHFMLPITDILTAQVLTALLVFRRKAVLESREIERLLRELSYRYADRHQADDFQRTTEHWSLLVNFVTQTLDLHRMIFLEAIDGNKRLREVAAYQCSLSDIDERRRDYGRTPYSTAIEAKGPIPIDAGHPYLRRGDEPGQEFLIPLLFRGKVLGFWALIASEETEGFQDILRAYGEQLAELLYRRHSFQLAEANSSGFLTRLLTFTSESEGTQALDRAIDLLQRRLGRSERLFAESSTPTISYDLFGRVREVNGAMLEFLRGEGLAPYEMNAHNLIAAFTGNEPAFARRCLRNVLLDHRRLSLPIQTKRAAKSYLLKIYALKSLRGEAASDPSPFNINGICCELWDRTASVQLDRLKEQLAGRVSVHLRNDLAAVELSASLLAGDDMSAAEREEISEMISDKIRQVVNTLAETQKYFSSDREAGADRLPVDPQASFDAAQQATHMLATIQGVRIEVHKPDIMNHVLASPEQLQQVFEAILTLILHDAHRGSAIVVDVEDAERGIRYSFASKGMGVANDRFQEYLFGKEEIALDDYKNLRRVLGLLKSWGGTAEAHSAFGEGMNLSVALPRFG